MHEYSLVASVMDRVLEIAKEQGNLPVEEVNLDIGVLQEIVPELLVWAFDAAKEDTLAANAALRWKMVPARLCCDACGATYAPEDDVFWQCPKCRWNGAEVLEGDELHIRTIKLTESDEPEKEQAKE